MGILRSFSLALLLAEIGPQIRFINEFRKTDPYAQLARLSGVFYNLMLKVCDD